MLEFLGIYFPINFNQLNEAASMQVAATSLFQQGTTKYTWMVLHILMKIVAPNLYSTTNLSKRLLKRKTSVEIIFLFSLLMFYYEILLQHTAQNGDYRWPKNLTQFCSIKWTLWFGKICVLSTISRCTFSPFC